MTITIERPETKTYLAQRFQFSTAQPAIGIKRVNACIVIEGGEEVSPSSLMGEAGILVWPTELPFDLSEMIAAEGPVLVEIGTDPDAEEMDGELDNPGQPHGEECNCMDCRSENRAYANSYEGD
jgi:hypothetical protein